MAIYIVLVDTCCQKHNIDNRILFAGLDGYLESADYNNDLICIVNDRYDIMKIYVPYHPGSILNIDTESCTLIWERPASNEFTMQEIADKLGIPVAELKN